MIGRSDGGFAGGVLPLTDEMSSTARGPPGSATSASTTSMRRSRAIEQAGGKTLMPATDIPNVGRIAMVADPQGDPFYVMKPIPPGGHPERAERRLLGRPAAARPLERAVDH